MTINSPSFTCFVIRSYSWPCKVSIFSTSLPDYEASTWNCLFAPAGTPAEPIATINAALNKALALQAVKDRLAQGASQPLGPSTPEQTEAYAQAQRAKWVPFIRALQINVG